MKKFRRDWPEQPWQAPPAVAALVAQASGNQINGVGENVRRKPRQIFWARKPDTVAHSALQSAVVDRFNGPQVLRDVYSRAERGPRKLPPAAPEKTADEGEALSARVKAFVLNQPDARPAGYPGAGSDAELVGIARMNQDWVYEGFEPALPFVIVMGVVMDHARLAEVSSDPDQPVSALEVGDQYNRGARVANHTAHWIRSLGYDARPHAGPWVGSLSLVPAALAAGFGELGKHGSIINPRYGSSFRLAAVETDMPLVPDAPVVFGADDFCTRCRVCTDACPPQAIADEKDWVRGELKWWVEFDKCIPYFNQTFGCGICIAACPWSAPGRAPRLAETWARRSGGRDD